MWFVIILAVVAIYYVFYHASGGREAEYQRAITSARQKEPKWEQKWLKQYRMWPKDRLQKQIMKLERQLEKPILAYFGLVTNNQYERKIKIAQERDYLLGLVSDEMPSGKTSSPRADPTDSELIDDSKRQHVAFMRVRSRIENLVDDWDASYADMPLPKLYLSLRGVYRNLKTRLEGPWHARSLAEHEWVVEGFFECRYCLGWISAREGLPAQEWLPKEKDFPTLITSTIGRIEDTLREYESSPPTDFWAADGEIATSETSERRNMAFFKTHRAKWQEHHARFFAIVHKGELVTFIKEKEKAIAYAEENFSNSVVLVALV